MIQQVPLYGTAAERLVEVLAVDVDEHLAQGLELLHGNGIAVDERARPAVGVDDPAQQTLFILVERLILEPRAGFGETGYVEFCAELGALRTVAHQLAAAALSEDQAQGVDEDRFAGAGFARQHGHSRFELDVDPVDDRKVPHLQIHQHG